MFTKLPYKLTKKWTAKFSGPRRGGNLASTRFKVKWLSNLTPWAARIGARPSSRSESGPSFGAKCKNSPHEVPDSGSRRQPYSQLYVSVCVCTTFFAIQNFWIRMKAVKRKEKAKGLMLLVESIDENPRGCSVLGSRFTDLHPGARTASAGSALLDALVVSCQKTEYPFVVLHD